MLLFFVFFFGWLSFYTPIVEIHTADGKKKENGMWSSEF